MPTTNSLIGIVKALNATRIENCNDIVIQETMLKIFVLIGLRKEHYFNEYENQFFINYVRKHYSHKTIDELYIAFELAIQGKLDLDNVKVYDQFSIAYFEQIMGGYRRWLKEESKKVIAAPIEKTSVVITQEEKLQDIEDWKQKKGIRMHFIPTYIYDYMVEFGLINLSKEEKQDIYKQAVEMRKGELYNKMQFGDKIAKIDYRDFVNSVEANDELSVCKNMAKKIAVFNYLKSIKNAN
jgi:hypothetical protein